MRKKFLGPVFVLLIQAAAVFAGGTEKPEEKPGAAGNSFSGCFNFGRPEERIFLGLSAGYTNNAALTNIPADFMEAYHFKYEAFHGWAINIPARFQIFNWLGVQAEFSYTARNYACKWTPPGPSGESSQYMTYTINHFIDFPVMANLSCGFPGKKLYVFMNIGFFAGVWAAGQVAGSTFNHNTNVWDNLNNGRTASMSTGYVFYENYEFDKRRDSRFDGGFLAGTGLRYKYTSRLSFFTECRYNLSFTSMRKHSSNQPYMKNSTLLVQFGVLTSWKASGKIFRKSSGKDSGKGLK